MNRIEVVGTQNVGGNEVCRHKDLRDGTNIFAQEPYNYYLLKLNAGDVHKIDTLESVAIYAAGVDGYTTVNGSNADLSLENEDVIVSEKNILKLVCHNGSSELLVAGMTESDLSPMFSVLKASDVKRVVKPWGYELWLTDEHPGFAFKKIFLKAGNKTSLQYHRRKRETNLLLEGSVNLHYCGRQMDLDKVSVADVEKKELSAITSIDVVPNTLHRLEAITDIHLFEVSTPDLDDVVRISDDSGRGDGRIAAEHDGG